MRFGFRAKLLSACTVLLLLIIGPLAWMGLQRNQTAVERIGHAKGETAIRGLAFLLQQDQRDSEAPGLIAFLAQYADQQELSFISVYSKEGKMLAGVGPEHPFGDFANLAGGLSGNERIQVRTSEGYREFLTDLQLADGTQAYCVIGVDRTEIRNEVARTSELLMIAMAGAIIMGWLGFLLIITPAARRIDLVRSYAERLTRGTPVGTLKIDSGDELGELAFSLNAIAEKLQRGSRKPLEKLVKGEDGRLIRDRRGNEEADEAGKKIKIEGRRQSDKGDFEVDSSGDINPRDE